MGLTLGGQERLASAQMGLRFKAAPLLELLPDAPDGRHAKAKELRDLTRAPALFIELENALAR